MNARCLALLSGLAILGATAFADQAASDAGLLPSVTGEVLKPFFYLPESAQAILPAVVEFQGPVVRMATYRVKQAAYPRYHELEWAATQSGFLEPCALIKANVTAKRRYNLFVAPVALSNGAAGFPLAQMAW